MSQVVTIELDLPDDLAQFQLPAAVNARLHELLDRQDNGNPLKKRERRQAEGLVELAEFLTPLRLRPRTPHGRPSHPGGHEVDHSVCLRPEGAATKQPGATPWGPTIAADQQCPERARQRHD